MKFIKKFDEHQDFQECMELENPSVSLDDLHVHYTYTPLEYLLRGPTNTFIKLDPISNPTIEIGLSASSNSYSTTSWVIGRYSSPVWTIGVTSNGSWFKVPKTSEGNHVYNHTNNTYHTYIFSPKFYYIKNTELRLNSTLIDKTIGNFSDDRFVFNDDETFNTKETLALFGAIKDDGTLYNPARSSQVKIYYAKIWEGNKLVYDLIPVLDNKHKPCMLNKVDGKLFYNEGVGEFTYQLKGEQ